MYTFADYYNRGMTFVRNQAFPHNKRLSNIMIYATDLCDSACKHCLIWTKRPVTYLPKEKIIELISTSKCITPDTTVGLEGGEFLLHPQALEIMEWFSIHHPKFDLLSNCLKPQQLIEAVKKFPPKRLWISLDGNKDSYLNMRGKDGYDKVLQVIRELHTHVPISVMFTLSPYNDFNDMQHVAEVCKQHNVDMRVGIYNNIAFFDTIDQAHTTDIGTKKDEEVLTLQVTRKRKENATHPSTDYDKKLEDLTTKIPSIIKEFKENYDFLVLYNNWRQNKTRLRCFSIFDSIIVLPNGDVPICQNLDLKLGNVHNAPLDEIINSAATVEQQKEHSKNCNKCWINYHRKYDVVLYKSFENFFGRWVTQKLFGYYQWDESSQHTYKELFKP